MRNTLIHLALFAGIFVPAAAMQTSKSAPKYPLIEEYLMSQPSEIALAKSAAPASISERATIKVLSKNGFEAVHQGDNGFVCLVIRGFTAAPTFTSVKLRAMPYDP
jgi:hypothetical protein